MSRDIETDGLLSPTNKQWDSLYFGEQFLLGQKVKWDIYKGNHIVEVPLKLGVGVVKNPLTGKDVVLRDWEESVTPKAVEYDEELSREHYLITSNAAGNANPPALGCGGYSKMDKIVDFTTWTNRAWAEIPKGGVIEWNEGTDNSGAAMYMGVKDIYNTPIGKYSGALTPTLNASLEILAINKATYYKDGSATNVNNEHKNKYYYQKGRTLRLVDKDNSSNYFQGEIESYADGVPEVDITIKVNKISGDVTSVTEWSALIIPHKYNLLFDAPENGYQMNAGLNLHSNGTKGNSITSVSNNKWQGVKTKPLDLSKGDYNEDDTGPTASDTWGS